MRPLNGTQQRKVIHFLRDLYALRSWDNLTKHIVESIPALISTDICSYNEMSSRRQHATYRMWPSDRQMIPDAPEILGRYTNQHPLVTHMERTKDFTSRKITDFLSQRQFRKTELFNELYGPLQVPYNMAAGLTLDTNCLVAIGLNRNGKDFTPDELAIMELLRPHVVQAFGNASTVTRMLDELSALNRAMEEMDRALLAFTPEGHIQWTTPKADRLMKRYGLQDGRRFDRLSTPLREWIAQYLNRLDHSSDLPSPLQPLVIDRGERTLTIRLVRDGVKLLLFLDEAAIACTAEALAALGVSRREGEILSWVVRGKTNPEIAVILSISPRTVQKHLEHIYSSLGVENRHAAIVMSLEAMRREYKDGELWPRKEYAMRRR